MTEQIYTNYRLQLPNQEILGTLVVREGKIAEIQPGKVATGQDGGGDYLLPGLVELHTDNLEKCMAPRPGVKWPLEAAAVYHDKDLISSGITTVCDAIAIGDIKPGSNRISHFTPMIDIIEQGQKQGRFAVDHRVHLRCELSFPEVYEITEKYIQHPLLSLVSIMDHTPGQRQFVSIEKYKEYYIGKHGIPAKDMDTFVATRQAQQQQYAATNRQGIVALTQQYNVSLASHDDATIEHIEEAVKNKVKIAEFPTTLDAAQAARDRALQILMGAPNLVLGGSHSGNIAALDLVKRGLVDIISSDYVPRSLLQAAFIIAKQGQKPLYEAIKPITSNPAKAIQLDAEIGSLEVGKKADLVTVHYDNVVPVITSVLRQGKRVA